MPAFILAAACFPDLLDLWQAREEEEAAVIGASTSSTAEDEGDDMDTSGSHASRPQSEAEAAGGMEESSEEAIADVDGASQLPMPPSPSNSGASEPPSMRERLQAEAGE
jgi:hypothetical protein